MILASKAKEACLAGQYDVLFAQIYQDRAQVPYQRSRYAKALSQYIQQYGDGAVEIYSAPGRTEIGGNHTDHQHGCVLAAAVNLDIIAIAGKTPQAIRIQSDELTLAPIETNSLSARGAERGTSEALVRGICARFQALGYRIGGFDAFLTSDVLVGSGLSSSAAFEVMIATILNGLYNDMRLEPILLAKAGQYAENEYFGKPCGLMDQCASAVGGLIHLDFRDAQQPKVQKLSVDLSAFGYGLCIVDTKGSHADLTNEYAAIPQEMHSVAQVFGQEYLRDVPEEVFYSQIAQVRQACQDRAVLRAMHFFAENKRVSQQVAALIRGDIDAFLHAVQASGNSSYKFLQNVYSCHEPQHQSISLALAVSEKILEGQGGVCRVHGGGFAGTIQAFVPEKAIPCYKTQIENMFGENTCHVLKIRSDGGKKVL